MGNYWDNIAIQINLKQRLQSIDLLRQQYFAFACTKHIIKIFHQKIGVHEIVSQVEKITNDFWSKKLLKIDIKSIIKQLESLEEDEDADEVAGVYDILMAGVSSLKTLYDHNHHAFNTAAYAYQAVCQLYLPINTISMNEKELYDREQKSIDCQNEINFQATIIERLESEGKDLSSDTILSLMT